MRFLYATDTHLKARNPSCRLDDYPSEMLSLLEELGRAAKQHRATAVLHGGDLFDTPRVSLNLYQQVCRILRRFPCPVYVVPGNHDLIGMSLDTLPHTMLGALAASGLVRLVTRKVGAVYFHEDEPSTLSVAVYGQEFSPSLDRGNPEDYRIDPDPWCDYHILMTHSMLVEKPLPADIPHTCIDDVETEANLVLGAHFHPGWGLIRKGKTLFCHPGAMARLEGTTVEASRPVQYVIIDIDKNGISVQFVPFENARPGHEVIRISREEKAELLAQHALLDSFRQKVQAAAVFNKQNPVELVRLLADKGNVDENVLQEAEAAMKEAQDLLDETNPHLKGFVESKTPVSISYLDLKNFQSHSETRLCFAENGLNAIIGPSDSGKTSILRALRWALYNEPRGSEFIRHGQDRVQVSVGFSNGSWISRTRTRTETGNYAYGSNPQEQKTLQGFGRHVPIEITNIHQMPKVFLRDDLEVSLNMAGQLDAPFLLSETPSVRAAVMGRLTGVHLLDEAARLSAKTTNQLQRSVKENAERMDELKKRLEEEFADIPELEEKVEALQDVIEKGRVCEEKLNLLRQLRDQYRATLAEKRRLLAAHRQASRTLRQLQKVTENLENALARYRALSGLACERNKLIKLRSTLNEELKHVRKVLTLREGMTQAEENWEKRSQLVQLKKEHVQRSEMRRMLLQEKKKAQQEIERLLDAYVGTLEEAGRCPTCESEVDEVVLKNLREKWRESCGVCRQSR